jgi:hypothetical protein
MPEIEWNEADADDGTLVVPLAPAPDKAWRKAAKAILAELTVVRPQWSVVSVSKDGFAVRGAADLDAGDVRFFLESVVQQADAAVAPPEAEAETGPDAELAARYRGFAT